MEDLPQASFVLRRDSFSGLSLFYPWKDWSLHECFESTHKHRLELEATPENPFMAHSYGSLGNKLLHMVYSFGAHLPFAVGLEGLLLAPDDCSVAGATGCGMLLAQSKMEMQS